MKINGNLHPDQVWWLNEHKGKPGMYKGEEDVKFELIEYLDLPENKNKQYAKIIK